MNDLKRRDLQVGRRATYLVLLTLFYAIAASQTLWSFGYKWTTIASHHQYSLAQTLAGESPKPYAYRMLMPRLVVATFTILPAKVATAIEERSAQTLERIIIEGKQLDSTLTKSYGIIMLLNCSSSDLI